MIGDSDYDVKAGRNAGCMDSYMLNDTTSLQDVIAEIISKDGHYEKK